MRKFQYKDTINHDLYEDLVLRKCDVVVICVGGRIRDGSHQTDKRILAGLQNQKTKKAPVKISRDDLKKTVRRRAQHKLYGEADERADSEKTLSANKVGAPKD